MHYLPQNLLHNSLKFLFEVSKVLKIFKKGRTVTMTKRTRVLSSNVENPLSTEPEAAEKEELTNAHITGASKKANTGKSASCKIGFQPRKIRNVSLQDKDKSPLIEDAILKNPKEVMALSSEESIQMAIKHLKESDLKLSSVIEMHDTPTLQKCENAFQYLLRSIVYQQLATKAAATIYNRLVSLCGGENCVMPETISKLSAADMRTVGISERKASYVQDLASNFMSGVLSKSLIFEMDDDSLISSLTAVRGIGLWSVHMFMIFALHRPDVLPVGDLGVRKGIQKLNALKALPTPAQMEVLSNSWRPYRTVGSWYMWRLIGTKAPISSSK